MHAKNPPQAEHYRRTRGIRKASKFLQVHAATAQTYIMPTLIELFSAPHCSNCASVAKQIEARFAGDNIELRRRNVLENIDRAVDLGILRTPALVIDGRLVHQGAVSTKRLEQLLSEVLCPE